MIRFVVLVAVFSVAFAASVPLDPEGRIVGGSTASPGQFPYQISLRRTQSRSHTCGGSILNSRFVLTAAHCVYGSYLDDLYVVVGTNTLNSGGQSYSLSAGAYHGGYDPQNILNDIAILKVSSDIQFNTYVQPIPLQTSEVPPGAGMTLSGWGLTSYPGNIPNNLQFATLTAIDINQCANAVRPGVITNSQICTFTRAGQGACQGDSGGPLVYGGRVSGVVSWGNPCAKGYPDVYTKVSAFNSWIQQTMGSM